MDKLEANLAIAKAQGFRIAVVDDIISEKNPRLSPQYLGVGALCIVDAQGQVVQIHGGDTEEHLWRLFTGREEHDYRGNVARALELVRELPYSIMNAWWGGWEGKWRVKAQIDWKPHTFVAYANDEAEALCDVYVQWFNRDKAGE